MQQHVVRKLVSLLVSFFLFDNLHRPGDVAGAGPRASATGGPRPRATGGARALPSNLAGLAATKEPVSSPAPPKTAGPAPPEALTVMRASHALRHREIVVSPALMVQRGDCNVHGYILGDYRYSGDDCGHESSSVL